MTAAERRAAYTLEMNYWAETILRLRRCGLHADADAVSLRRDAWARVEWRAIVEAEEP